MKILWLEDEEDSVILEKNRLKKYVTSIYISSSIKTFVDDLDEKKIYDNDIFVLDIMMPQSDGLDFSYMDKGVKITETINSHVSAGIEFYNKYIKKIYPNNIVIFYTIRADKDKVIDILEKDNESFNEKLFLLYKMESKSLENKIKMITVSGE